MVVMKSIKGGITGDALSCGCDVRDDFRPIPRKIRLLERVETTSSFPVCEGKM